MKGLGYRQRAVLDALITAGHPLPTGYLRRQILDDCDPRTLHMALHGLRTRGLVVHVGYGKWSAA